MSNAVMPLAHYKETCDAIRDKTGSTDTIKSREMPDKINDVFRAGQLDIVSSAEALKGSVSGSIVTMSDVSPVEHDIKVQLESDTITNFAENGKNLFDGVLEQGSYNSIDGTRESSTTRVRSVNFITVEAGEYTLSADSDFLFYVFVYDMSGNYLNTERFTGWSSSNIMTFTSLGKRKIKICIRNKSNSAITPSDVSWVQFEKGAIATEYEPYDISTKKVSVFKLGKNIFPIGSFETGRQKVIGLNPPLPIGTYTISAIYNTTATSEYSLLQFVYADGSTSQGGVSTGFYVSKNGEKQTATKTFPKPVISIIFNAWVNWANSSGITTTYTDFMIERGTTATEYEPYIEPIEYTANADGTVSGIKSLYPNMTLLTDTEGVIVTAEYIKDIDKAFEERLAEIEKALVNN